MRILILSWRDPQNPKAGGAELFTQEVARRMVAKGDSVEWFAARFDGAAPETELDGVHIVRAGRQWSVHVAAVRRYRGRLRRSFDALIDEVNTIPFFAPLWADIPHLLLIFQLAREVWWHESFFPVSAIGYGAEPLYLRAYRRTPALTISASTESDLKRLGFVSAITVLPIGLEAMAAPHVVKAEVPTFLYVGRMAPSKRVDLMIKAFARYGERSRPGRLWLVGDGPAGYLHKLRGLVARLGVEDTVQFLGRVPTEQKHVLMARAHVLLMASVREGWGLSIAEANACGTPAVVVDVPGLRDAVRDGETGLVVAPTPEGLAGGMIRMTSELELYSRLATEARRWSQTFSFDSAADLMRATIADAIRDAELPARTPPSDSKA